MLNRIRHRYSLGALGLLALVAGCAVDSSATAAPATGHTDAAFQRVLVRVSATPGAAEPDAQALARQAAQSAGVPVRHAASVSPRWHSLVLECPSSDACVQALRRLSADTSHFDAVEPDAQRQLISPRSDAKQ